MTRRSLLFITAAIFIYISCCFTANARWIITQGTSTISTANDSFWTWNELLEAGWSGSTTNYNIVFFENTVDGGGETSAGGGLAGGDLTYSDGVSNVLGATGNPPSRNMDGVNDFFVGADAVPHLVRDSASGWGIAWKCKPTTGAAMRLLNWANNGAGGSNQIEANITAAGKVNIVITQGDGTTRLNYTSTASVVDGSNLWVVVQADAAGNLTYGWKSTTKPVSFVDCTETGTGTGTVVWNGGNELDWAGHANCGLYGRVDFASPFNGPVYYFVVGILPFS